MNPPDQPTSAKIRVLKCTSPSAWYADRIGLTLPVSRIEINLRPSQGIPEDVYWCRTGDAYNTLNYVRFSDAEVITPTPDLAPTPRTDRRELSETVSAHFARRLERELAAAKAKCESLHKAGTDTWGELREEIHAKDAELARLRAEVENMALQLAKTADRNVALRLDADRLRAELALANARCPHVVSTAEGTHHCALAESTVAKLSAQLAEARKDSERFNLLASMLEDVNIGDMDPTKHRTDDNDWPDAWRDAIDAAMTTSNHKTT